MPKYFVFEVSLRDVKPRLWRRFMIASTAKFVDLHEAIQDACGWTNSHLFAFRNPRGYVIAELSGDDFDETGPDAMKEKISTYFDLTKGYAKRGVYQYDFGDNWIHDLVLEDVVSLPEKFGRRLLAGARAFPPDDCGGTWGYEDCVKVATGRKKDPERLEWLDGWKPEKFDFKETEKLYYQSKLFLRGHYEVEPM